jgi:hypothetical protein
MTATLKMTHKTIGVEVRRGTYDVMVDGHQAGALQMNDTIKISVDPGRHTLQIRDGRNSSRVQTFVVADGLVPVHRKKFSAGLPLVLRHSEFGTSPPP